MIDYFYLSKGNENKEMFKFLKQNTYNRIEILNQVLSESSN